METLVLISYWSETSDRSLRQPLIIVTWSFSDLLLNDKLPVALRWAWLVQPITGPPTDSASAVFDSAASAGSFRVGAARQSEEDTLKQETDITKRYNYHKNQTRQVDMVMEQEAGDSFQKPVWNYLCWPERGSAPLQRTAAQKYYKGHNKEEEFRFITLNNSQNITADLKQPNIKN